MNRTVIAGIMTWINFATLSFLFLIFSWFAALLGLMAFFEGDSSFKKTWTTKTKKGTSKQNISQISMNFKYAVCGSDWEMLWYIVYMTSMIVRDNPMAKSRSCLLKKRVNSAINSCKKRNDCLLKLPALNWTCNLLFYPVLNELTDFVSKKMWMKLLFGFFRDIITRHVLGI